MKSNTIPFIIGNFMPLHSGHVRHINALKRNYGHVVVVSCLRDMEQYRRLKGFFIDDSKVTVLQPCNIESNNPEFFFNVLRASLIMTFGNDKDFLWVTSKRESGEHYGFNTMKLDRSNYPSSKTCRKSSRKWWDYICPPWRPLYTHKVLLVSHDPEIANEVALDFSKELHLPKPPKYCFWQDHNDPYWDNINTINSENELLIYNPLSRGVVVSAADSAYIRHQWPEIPFEGKAPNWDKVFYLGKEDLNDSFYAFLVNHGYNPEPISTNYFIARNYINYFIA